MTPDLYVGISLQSPKSATSPRILALGVVDKLHLQDEVGKWSKNVHFLSTFIL